MILMGKPVTGLRPLDDRVYVRPHEQKRRSAGGIVLPETLMREHTTGVVVACGPGKLLGNGQRTGCTVKPGDEIVFVKFAGSEVEVNGELHVVMRQHEIFAVLEADE